MPTAFLPAACFAESTLKGRIVDLRNFQQDSRRKKLRKGRAERLPDGQLTCTSTWSLMRDSTAFACRAPVHPDTAEKYFMNEFKQIDTIQPSRKNSSFLLSEIMVFYRYPTSLEGRIAVVTDVEAGCGGRIGVAA